MAGAPDRYPDDIRNYVLAQVFDRGRKLKPLVEALQAGRVDGFPRLTLSYSTAQRWVAQERQLRDAASPLNGEALEEYRRRLWAVGMAELRKLERDSRGKKPLDAKRLNDLEAFATKCSRHLAAEDPPEDPDAPEEDRDPDRPETLLERLAKTEAEPSAAASNPQETEDPLTVDRPGPIQAGSENTNKDKAKPSPAHIRGAAEDQRQPLVA